RSTVSAADVLGSSPSTNRLTTDTRPWRLRSDRAPRNAAAFIFLGVRWAYERGTGPWTVPPPAYCGARSEPWRAPPVAFCRDGFLPPPPTPPPAFVPLAPPRPPP